MVLFSVDLRHVTGKSDVCVETRLALLCESRYFKVIGSFVFVVWGSQLLSVEDSANDLGE